MSLLHTELVPALNYSQVSVCNLFNPSISISKGGRGADQLSWEPNEGPQASDLSSKAAKIKPSHRFVHGKIAM